MSPELSKILQDLVSFMVRRPAEVQLLAALSGANKEVVAELISEAADISERIEDDSEATSAIVQKLFARKSELLPQKQIAHKHYLECPNCGIITKHELGK